MWKTLVLVLACSIALSACNLDKNGVVGDVTFSPGETVDFAFESEGLTLSGMFDIPDDPEAKALILFVHGYGETDIRTRQTFSDLRRQFNQIGIATAVWDKPGQGRSEGEFDINQSVYSSSEEVLNAARYLRQVNAPGAHKIGVWGVSRGGWIVPIALSKDKDLRFWISVSGTTAEDNFAYLLLSNLPHEGGTIEQATLYENEWRNGCRAFRQGKSYEDYLSATENLRASEYMQSKRGDWPSSIQYYLNQKSCDAGVCKNMDTDLCSYVFIEQFDQMLSSLDVDVLAVFGEKDLHVDWQKTRDLYQATLGSNPKASLKLVSFEDADHNLNISQTGSIAEIRTNRHPQKTKGYYDVQVSWLKKHVLNEGAIR